MNFARARADASDVQIASDRLANSIAGGEAFWHDEEMCAVEVGAGTLHPFPDTDEHAVDKEVSGARAIE